ncbi:MAG: hypothetical protein PHW74_12500 [Desulfobacca sp.]|nr:hypothetical protein [Desulfobacca sp.]
MSDEFDFPTKGNRWTIISRKYALMQRDPLVTEFNRKLKESPKDYLQSTEGDNLAKQIRKKWAVKIYIPETTIQGLTDFWFPVSLESYNFIEDARQAYKIILAEALCVNIAMGFFRGKWL